MPLVFRRVLHLLSVSLFTFLVLAAPTAVGAEVPKYPSLAGTLKPADVGAEALLVVHYHRFDGNYAGWNLWSWAAGQEGAEYGFSGKTPFGAYAVVPLKVKPERAGIIVRRGNWEQKDSGGDRFVSFGPSAVTEVWLVSGDDTVYSDPSKVDFSVKPIAAFLDAPDLITFSVTGALDAEQTSAITVSAARDGSAAPVVASVERVDTPTSTRLTYAVKLLAPVRVGDLSNLRLTLAGFNPLTVYARDVLNAPEYMPLDAKLGYQYGKAATAFQTWSPVSTAVELLLYSDIKAMTPTKVIPLTAGEKGLWSVEVPGDLHGTPYRYRFTSYGVQREVPDIHTFAASYNSKFSVVADLSRLTPEGWGTVPAPRLAQPTDEIIYEIHVRDFSIADKSVPAEQRGTYLGLIHENPATATTASSGLTHLKELGVTGVHLLPIQDFSAEIGEYNWGYWTALFNVPEANFSTTPMDPLSPIVELRTAIQGLHRAGIRVILDVVYNHTSTSGAFSPFDQTVPYFYFRTSPDGRMLNDAGVGNSIADERPMVRKYIVDSLAFWTENYRIDGFRFDLLGTHHAATVHAVEQRLLPLRQDLTLYGEPWTGGGTIHFGKGAQRGLRMAVFNDHLRNALRGDLDGEAAGFATGSGGNVQQVRNGLAGSIDDFTENPTETINYASAHDNTILWDKLVKTNPTATDAELRQMQKLAQGAVILSQGIPFLHGGCDFARTKNGNHNSYNAGDEINQFDWELKQKYLDVHNYLRGLIALRKSEPAMRLAKREQVREQMRFLDPQRDGVIVYSLDSVLSDGSVQTLVVALNGNAVATSITLPAGEWSVLVDDVDAGTKALRVLSGEVQLPAFSIFVARK